MKKHFKEIEIGNIVSDIELGGKQEATIFKAVRKEDDTIYFKSVTDEDRNPYGRNPNGEYPFDMNGPGYFWLIAENRD